MLQPYTAKKEAGFTDEWWNAYCALSEQQKDLVKPIILDNNFENYETAHVAIVFTRYLMIAMEQRRCEDNRTLGEIFFFFTDELTDITFGESFQILINAMIESICAIFQPTEEQLALFLDMFVGRLPEYIRNSLAKAALAA